MKAAEIKTTTASLQKKGQPFFRKGDGKGFFSDHTMETSFFAKSRNTHPVIQPKLTIGQPNDKYEKEADAMADKVVQRLAMPEVLTKKEAGVQTKPLSAVITPILQTKCAACEQEEKLQKKDEEDLVQESPLGLQLKPIFESNAEPPDDKNNIQRKCATCEQEEKLQKKEDADLVQESDMQVRRKPIFESNAEPPDDTSSIQRKCEECEEEEKLQKKQNSSDSPKVSSHIENSLNSSKGRGTSIPTATKEQMENSFGADFSNVRIHTDSSAVQMSKDLHAQAFTNGSDIYFNAGKYDINSESGKHLLAHELTHTVQQGKGIAAKIQRLGDLSKVPPMPCDVANTSSAGTNALTSLFPTSSTTLSAQQRDDIVIFVASWRASGATDTLRVDGFASKPGSDETNWKLSCNRALSVANELRNNGVPDSMIEIFAQGETDEFGAQGNNQRADISIIAPPPPPKITSETVVTSPGSRARTAIGVGEVVKLTHSLGSAATAWVATAGTLSAPTGPFVLFTAPDTAQTVTITADGASIAFRIIPPDDVFMDNPSGVVKHNQNFPDSGILTDVFLLPDNVNFNKVTYRELDVAAVASGTYSCHSGAEHCSPAGFGPCRDKSLTDTVISGKGTKSVSGDCAYSGHCGGSPPFTAGSLSFSIPYEYKVGAGSFIRFKVVPQRHVLAADASTLTTDKAGANGSTTVGAATALIAVCP